MKNDSSYAPPAVRTWEKENSGKFANVNRPIAGATHDKQLPVGKHPLQVYSMATPNGVNVTVMLEELLALGHAGAEYDAWIIDKSRRPRSYTASRPTRLSRSWKCSANTLPIVPGCY